MGLLSVIIHCDLDCFYAQVERERLRLEQDACIAVVQWNSALAVSYPARKYGIKRGANVEEIRRLGGDRVKIVHVETIGGEAASAALPVSREDGADVVNTQKVSLARYRKASSNVFSVMASCLVGFGGRFERASIDEAYIDVTAEVDKRINKAGPEIRERPARTVVVGDKLDLENETDIRLAYGADIAAEIRSKIFKELSYTVSAGISVNKLLSKFASAQNKPNNQTIVPLCAVSTLMADVPLHKLRGLGGKLGREVQAMGVSTAGEAAKLSMENLEQRLVNPKFAEFVYNSVRGVDETEVTERGKTKSLLAAKSFKGQYSLDPVKETWLPLLAEELAERLLDDTDLNNRDAKTLTVSFRLKENSHTPGGEFNMISASRSTAMPALGADGRSAAILSTSINILEKVIRDEKKFCFPITFVGLTATNFVDRATINESIARYFHAVGKEKGSKEATNTNGAMSEAQSTMTKAEIHQRRLQESADRALALRLHREENVRRDGRQSKKGTLLTNKIAKRKTGRKGMSTLDSFVTKKGDKAIPKR